MKRRIALVAVALVLALLGVTAVRSYVGKADARAVAGVDATDAYVVAKTIPAGTTLQRALDQGLVRKEALPKRTVPTSAVSQATAQLRSEVALGDLPAGTLLMAASFGAKQSSVSVLSVPAGKMAVSVALEDSREAELVQPGAEIAIFDTFNTVVNFDAQGRLQSGDRSSVAGDGLSEQHLINHATRVLLPRVEVLAVGDNIYKGAQSATSGANALKKSTNSQPSTANPTVIVTVAVDQHDAERLIQAVQTGHLYLALLTGESKSAPGPGVDDTNLFQY